jgi:hypothetical protein
LIPSIFKIIHMKQEKLEKLFNQYEKAFDKLDLKAISELYGHTFISAGPTGTIARNKEEASKMAEDAANFYRNIGQNSARILSKKFTPISNEYTMAVIHWAVTFEKTGDKPVEFDVSYIVQETEEEPKIILFITHQDELQTMKKLGFQPELAGLTEQQ